LHCTFLCGWNRYVGRTLFITSCVWKSDLVNIGRKVPYYVTRYSDGLRNGNTRPVVKNSFKSPEAKLALDILSDRFKYRFGHYKTRTVPRISKDKQCWSSMSRFGRRPSKCFEQIDSRTVHNSVDRATPPNPTSSSYFRNLQLKLNSKTKITRSDAIILIRQHVLNFWMVNIFVYSIHVMRVRKSL